MWNLTFYSVAELQQTFTNLSAVIFLLLDRSENLLLMAALFCPRDTVFVGARTLLGWV